MNSKQQEENKKSPKDNLKSVCSVLLLVIYKELHMGIGYNKMDHTLPLMMALAFIIAINIISIAEAQIPPPCAEKMSPCLNYLNSTNPPSTCCNPIKDVVSTQLGCLCKFLLTPGIIDNFGVNITQAIQFAHYCDVTFNITICQAVISAEPPSSSVKPKATAGDDKGNAFRVTFSGLSFIILCLGYVLFI